MPGVSLASWVLVHRASLLCLILKKKAHLKVKLQLFKIPLGYRSWQDEHIRTIKNYSVFYMVASLQKCIPNVKQIEKW